MNPFEIGDALNWSGREYKTTYREASAKYGLSIETLRSYAYVALAVTPERRRSHLPFSYHRTVAKLSPERQVYWLDRAEAEGWNRPELSAAINGHTSPVPRDLYFARRRGSELIKIGVSANVGQRMNDLNAEAILVLPGQGTEEAKLHRKFRRFRVEGEWFRPAPELIAYMEGCRV